MNDHSWTESCTILEYFSRAPTKQLQMLSWTSEIILTQCDFMKTSFALLTEQLTSCWNRMRWSREVPRDPRVRCGRLCADANLGFLGFCDSCLALVKKKKVSANAIQYFCKNAAASSSPCFNDFNRSTSGLGRGFCFPCGRLWSASARGDALATDCFARANDCVVRCVQRSSKKTNRKRKMLE